MAASYKINLINEFSDVRPVCRISKVRPGEGDYTGKVVNVTVVPTRSWKEMKDGQVVKVDGKEVWKDKSVFLDLALWGKGVEFFHANPGDVLMADFSLADLSATPYTTKDDKAGMNFKFNRVNFLKVVARKNAEGQDVPVQEEPIAGGEPEESVTL
jgi:hypothetical protein